MAEQERRSSAATAKSDEMLYSDPSLPKDDSQEEIVFHAGRGRTSTDNDSLEGLSVTEEVDEDEKSTKSDDLFAGGGASHRKPSLHRKERFFGNSNTLSPEKRTEQSLQDDEEDPRSPTNKPQSTLEEQQQQVNKGENKEKINSPETASSPKIDNSNGDIGSGLANSLKGSMAGGKPPALRRPPIAKASERKSGNIASEGAGLNQSNQQNPSTMEQQPPLSPSSAKRLETVMKQNFVTPLSPLSPPSSPSLPSLAPKKPPTLQTSIRQSSTGSAGKGRAHNRNVSWQLDAPYPPTSEINYTFSSQDDEGASQVSSLQDKNHQPFEMHQQRPRQQQQQQPPKRHHRATPSLLHGKGPLKLSDLFGANPLECEAEAYLQQTIEETIQDPTMIPQVQKGVIDAPEELFEALAEPGLTEHENAENSGGAPLPMSADAFAWWATMAENTNAAPPTDSATSPAPPSTTISESNGSNYPSQPVLPLLSEKNTTAQYTGPTQRPSPVNRQTTLPVGISPNNSGDSNQRPGMIARSTTVPRPPPGNSYTNNGSFNDGNYPEKSQLKRGITSQLKKPSTLKSHQRGKSTAEDLHDLTLGFQNLQQRAGMRENSSGSSSSSTDGAPASAGEKMMQNASKLIKRHNKSKSQSIIETPVYNDSSYHNNNEDEKSTASGASNRWDASRGNSSANLDDSHRKKMDDMQESVIEEEDEVDIEAEKSTRPNTSMTTNNSHGRRSTLSRKKSMMRTVKRSVQSGFLDFEDWLKLKRMSACEFIKITLILNLLLVGIAAILFYLCGNPPCEGGVCSTKVMLTPYSGGAAPVANQTVGAQIRDIWGSASASWWLLFFNRQIFTFMLAKGLENFLIDFLALRTRFTIQTVGAFGTLFLVQSRGWPLTTFCWCIWDFILLFGNHRFALHWLYWQPIAMFNDKNPSGYIPATTMYSLILGMGIAISFAVAVKRFWLGLYLGRRTFFRYADDLARIMKRALFVGETASLAKELTTRGRSRSFDISLPGTQYMLEGDEDEDDDGYQMGKSGTSGTTSATGPKSIMKSVSQSESKASVHDGTSTAPFVEVPRSLNAKIDEILGAWEEPEGERIKEDIASIGDIIQFRQSLSYLNTDYPFGINFGRIADRKECVEATERLFERLLVASESEENMLKFDTLAHVAVRSDGTFDETKLRALVKLFRPDREGKLSLVDFAKSIDSCYKEIRLLKASVASSSKLDRAFESIFNVGFYLVVGCITVAVFGGNPLLLFASISGLVLGFSFMISAASSKYFEGLLFIFVRRPYDIGDRIHVSDPNADTSMNGSPGWIVKDVTLFATTVLFAATNEVATYSNGSLASSRIINAARSPRAQQYVYLKFPVETQFSKFQAFRLALEKFILARPREWRCFHAFRATRVEVDLGYIEYVVVVEHRESWQFIGDILNSKAELASFALELQKKMNIRYRSVPMPIDINLMKGNSPFDLNERPDGATRARSNSQNDDNYASISAMFDNFAK